MSAQMRLQVTPKVPRLIQYPKFGEKSYKLIMNLLDQNRSTFCKHFKKSFCSFGDDISSKFHSFFYVLLRDRVLLIILLVMSKVRADQFPSYQTAGLKKSSFGQTAQLCLQPTERNVQTPPEISKYRKSFKEQFGVTIQHYGTVGDSLPPKELPYGVPTQKSEGVKNIMRAGHQIGVGNYVQQLKQTKYDSFKREPLAKTISRGYNLPPDAQGEGFSYGVPTELNKYGVKETIYSGENMPESEEIRKLYLKSHKDYDPGEQKQRPYNWPVDPTDFRFGKVEKNPVHNEIKQILNSEAHNDNVPKTVFVKSNLHDFIDRKEDKLGLPTNLGQKQFPNDHVFGVRVEPNEWNAGKCITGEANEHQVRPDDDLGRTNKYGFRNITKEGDENRLFGVPTIRYDIPKPKMQSVADPNNYADQTTAVELLFPKQFASFGVDQQDFNVPRSKAEIRSIFENIGFSFKGSIFEVVFERAKAIQGTILDRVSCSSFKKSLLQLS